jgi:hypothetical protein
MKPYLVKIPLRTTEGVLPEGSIVTLPDDEAAILLAGDWPPIEPTEQPPVVATQPRKRMPRKKA